MEGTASEKKMKEAAIITETTAVVEEGFSYYNPCYCAQEALKALLNCLGFDGSPRPDQPASSSSEDGENQQVQMKPDSQETHDSGTGEAADPQSSTDPPAADPPAVEVSDAASPRTGRKPPPPPVDPGRDPGHN